MNRSPITTHVLDTATGKPAAGVPVTLFQLVGADWVQIAESKTDNDGRITDWMSSEQPAALATYKVIFDLDAYFESQAEPSFYPYAEICFRRLDDRHHHIPLLLSPFGYSTYRGS